jgi:hypothetical protein
MVTEMETVMAMAMVMVTGMATETAMAMGCRSSPVASRPTAMRAARLTSW